MFSVFSGRALARVKRQRDLKIAVCLPTLNEEATVGDICDRISADLISELGLVDELLVIDCGSTDATVEAALQRGAEVFATSAIAPAMDLGGKGEALWKSLSISDCDIIVWLDSDVSNFTSSWVVDLLGPLLTGQALLTKAFYRRHLRDEEEGGGRVTELLARPLINALWPAIGHLRQPLAGECASFTRLLRDIPMLSGYAVELGLMAEFARRYGGSSIAQVDLGVRRHRNRPLHQLALTSFDIIRGAGLLLESEGRPVMGGLNNTFIGSGTTGDTYSSHVRRLPPRDSFEHAAPPAECSRPHEDALA